MTTPCHQNIRSCNSKTRGVAEKYTKSAWIVHLDWTKRDSSYKLNNNSHEIVIANIGQTLADPFFPKTINTVRGQLLTLKTQSKKATMIFPILFLFCIFFCCMWKGKKNLSSVGSEIPPSWNRNNRSKERNSSHSLVIICLQNWNSTLAGIEFFFFFFS